MPAKRKAVKQEEKKDEDDDTEDTTEPDFDIEAAAASCPAASASKRKVAIAREPARIVSIDVGCKNLALSVVDVAPIDDSSFQYSIVHMGLYDLVKHTTISCRQCTSPAVYRMKNNNAMVLCRKKTCFKKAGIARALALRDAGVEPIHAHGVSTASSATSRRLAPLTTLAEGIFREVVPIVDKYAPKDPVTQPKLHIVIESQPTSGRANNQAMKCIQTILQTVFYAYFRTSAIRDRIVNIDFSPSSKFAVCMEELYAHASASSSQENQAAQASDAAREEGVAVKTTNGKRRKRLPRAVAAKISYAERKAFSTKMANTILQASDTQGLFSCLVTRVSEEHLSLCRKTFESAKKKDDLADSLLQALSYARITYEV